MESYFRAKNSLITNFKVSGRFTLIVMCQYCLFSVLDVHEPFIHPVNVIDDCETTFNAASCEAALLDRNLMLLHIRIIWCAPCFNFP